VRAAIYNGPERPITVERMPDPRPGAGEMVVRVHRCGICGSDMAMSGEGPSYLPLGRFGHEWSGEVVEIGSGLADVKTGMRIAGLPVAPCGSCEGCKTDNPLFCEANGYLVGGFGDYMVIPRQAAVFLPASLSFGDGALVEPMSCGLHALNLAQIDRGESVLVIGAGAMALSTMFWARRLGAGKIVALSRSAHRNEVALAMGADAVLGFDEDDRARAFEVMGGAPGIVAECVGKQGMLALAAQYVRRRGMILSLGMCSLGDPVVPAFMTGKEVKLLFPHGYTVEEFTRTAQIFDSGAIDPEAMVSDVIPLEALPRVMDELRTGARRALKVHVDPAL
jgi:(R,R)-butanediol dehydrogenase/meso-butanediol dehydrogenase/diacetyl reductase